MLNSLLKIDLAPPSRLQCRIWNPRLTQPSFDSQSSRSLNRSTRVKEISRINYENLELLKRLNNVSSVYNRNKLLKEGKLILFNPNQSKRM